MAKSKVHEVVVKIRTDKACTTSIALKALRENAGGTYYTPFWDETLPGQFRIMSYKTNAAERQLKSAIKALRALKDAVWAYADVKGHGLAPALKQAITVIHEHDKRSK